MKQTAVEWLVEKFSTQGTLHSSDISQAKAMEKEQIMDAREDGHLSTYAEYGSTPKCYLDGGHEQYYNETFKSE
jgi:hypothetical protein